MRINKYAVQKRHISAVNTKCAQQIQFTVGRLADLDSAYFSESGSVKIAYITDIVRFTRLATRLN